MELVTAVLGDHGQRPIDDYGTEVSFALSVFIIRNFSLESRLRIYFVLC